MNTVDGRQLKAARIILGLTVRELAEAAGLNRNSVLRVEAHENLPRHARAADLMTRVLEARGIVFTAAGGILGIHFSGLDKRMRPKYTRRPKA